MYYSYNDRKRNDFFIVTNNDNTKNRKNENLHALYSILDYCEEPFLCRRKLQLEFLGEKFDEKKCHQMCDNCMQNLKVVDSDVSMEAKKLLTLIIDFTQNSCDVTTK